MYTCTSSRGGTCLPQRYAGSRSDSSEPIPLVQRGCPGPEERQYTVFLHGLQVPQHTYEEGLVPPSSDSGGLGKHGGVSAFLVNGFKVGVLAEQNGPRIATIHGLHSGNLGFYEFTAMPFGLCNTLATFQCLMQNTLGELNLTYCVIYLDDVIVFSCIEEEHPECLHMVFERFWEFNLKLRPSKCSFFQLKIIYLVHHILRRGILPSEENVWAVQEFLMPETYTQVHTFCRLAGHYRRFIKGFSNIACPLYDMLGKEVKMGPVDLPPEAWMGNEYLEGKGPVHTCSGVS